MAGTVAHVLHVDIFEALELPKPKLVILYNEALRQRALDTIAISQGFGGGKESQEYIENMLKIHGHYTEGFYENELDSLAKRFGVK